MKYQDLKSLSKEYPISVFTFRKFIKMGLPHYRIGRKILVNPEEFEYWLKRFKITKDNRIDTLLKDAVNELE
jgi:hypothetical protein